MKKTVSLCLLSILLVVFGFMPDIKAQENCFWLEYVNDVGVEGNSLQQPERGRTDRYRIRFVNNGSLPLRTKVSLDWEIKRNGVVLGSLRPYADVKILTEYNRIANATLGASLPNGTPQIINGKKRSYPGAIEQFPAFMRISAYSLDFLYSDFFESTNVYLEITWNDASPDYEIELTLMERINGTDYPSFYWDPQQRLSIGGHQSIEGGVIGRYKLEPLVTSYDTVEICYGEEYTIGNPPQTFDRDTVVKVGFYNPVCEYVDSVVILNLTVNPFVELPEVNNVDYCLNDVAVPLTADTTQAGVYLEWSSDGVNYSTVAPTPFTDVAGVDTFYVRQVIDSERSNCYGDSAIILVTVHDLPLSPLYPDDTITACLNSTVVLEATVSGPNGIIQWSEDGENFSTAVPVVNTTAPGMTEYYLRQYDTVTACTSFPIDTITVWVFDAPVFTLQSDNNPICIGDSAILSVAGQPQYTWAWSGSSFTGTDTTVAPTQTTTYYVTAFEQHYGRETCSTVDSITITVNPLPVVEFAPFACNGVNYNPNPVLPANVTLTWNWNPALPAAFDTVLVNTNNYTIEVEFPYTAVNNVTGCQTIDTLRVPVGVVPEIQLSQELLMVCAGQPIHLEVADTTNYADPSHIRFTAWVTTQMEILSFGMGVPAVLDTVIQNGGTYTFIGGAINIMDFDYLQQIITGAVEMDEIEINRLGCFTMSPAIVNVNPYPTVEISSSLANDSTCLGTSVTLTVTGGNSIQWGPEANNATTSVVTVTPANIGENIYTVNVLDTNTLCAIDTFITIYAFPLPDFTVDPVGPVCFNDTVTLSVSGGSPEYEYVWSVGDVVTGDTLLSSIRVVPENIGENIYYVKGFSNITGCERTDSVIVTVNAIPVTQYETNPASGIVCNGALLQITVDVQPNTVYVWQATGVGPNLTTNPVNYGTDPEIMDYVVYVEDTLTSCSTYDTVQVTVRPTLDVEITAVAGNICSGDSAVLTVTGAFENYLWSTGDTTSTIVAYQSGVYSVTVTDEYECTATADYTLNVQGVPAVTITMDTNQVCNGTDVAIAAIAAGNVTYLWSYESSTDSAIVIPSTYLVNNTNAPVDHIFTLTVADSAAGCDTTLMVTITVNPSPHVSITNNLPPGFDYIICYGDSVLLTAVDFPPYADTTVTTQYLWSANTNAPDLTASEIWVSPTVETTYSVTATNSYGCIAVADNHTIQVRDRDTVNITGNAFICSSEITNILTTDKAFDSYLWNTGDTTRSINAVAEGDYVVTVQNASGCVAVSDTFTVSYYPAILAGVDTENKNDSVCQGTTVTVNIINTTPDLVYDWAHGSDQASFDTTLITEGWNYFYVTITDTLQQCSKLDTASIYVNMSPAPGIVIANDIDPNAVCAGDSVTFWIEGVNTNLTYDWSISGTSFTAQGDTIGYRFAVAETAIVSVTVTDGMTGCSNTATSTVTVNIVPDATIIVPSNPVCENSEFTLRANNYADAIYTWYEDDLAVGFSDTLDVTATETMVYTLVIESAQGCTATDSVRIDVLPLPQVTITPMDTIICNGSEVTFVAESLPTYTYIWNTGATTSAISVTPDTTSTYTLTVTDIATGCNYLAEVTVNVRNAPEIAFLPYTDSVCLNTTVSFGVIAENNILYTWPNGYEGTTLDSTFTVAGEHYITVTATDTTVAGLCESDTTIMIYVNDVPAPDLSGIVTNMEICFGDSAVLHAVPGYTYVWNDGSTADSLIVTPDTVGVWNYSNVITDPSTSCSTTINYEVTVRALPVFNAFTYEDATYNYPVRDTVCNNTSVRITASATGLGTLQYLWANNGGNYGQTLTVLAVAGDSATTHRYPVQAIDDLGCIAYDTANLVVMPTLVVTIVSDSAICEGSSTTFDAGAGYMSYLWSTGATSRTIQVSDNYTYSVTVTDAYGCFASDSHSVNVNPNPTTNARANNVARLLEDCPGEDGLVVLIETDFDGGYTYLWNTGDTTNSFTTQPLFNITDTILNVMFTVVVSNEFGCDAYDTVMVSLYPMPQPAIAGEARVCLGDTIMLTAIDENIYSNDGLNPTIFTWSNGFAGDTLYFVGTTYGDSTISVTATNDYGCSLTLTTTIVVDSLASPVITINGNPVQAADTAICNNNVITIGTVITYDSVLWSNGSTDATITVNPQADETYSVQVYLNGCMSEDSVSITVNMAPSDIAIQGDTMICTNDFANVLTIDTTGMNVISIVWNNNPLYNDMDTIPAYEAGQYIVTVEVMNGCSASDTVNVSHMATPAPEMIVTFEPAGAPAPVVNDSINVCPNNTEYFVNVNEEVNVNYTFDVYGNTLETSNMRWSLDSSAIAYSLFEGSLQATDSIIGVIVTATDSITGCSAMDTLYIRTLIAPVANPGDTAIICEGQFVDLSFSPAGENYSYLWDGMSVPMDTMMVNPTDDTVYYVTITETTLNCSFRDSIVVLVDQAPSITLSAIGTNNRVDTACLGDNNFRLIAEPSTYTYIWDARLTQIANDTALVPAAIDTTITYYVTVTATGNATCSYTDSITLTVLPAPVVNIISNVAGDTTCVNDTVMLIAAGGVEYLWTNTGETTDTIYVTSDIAQDTLWTVAITDAFGCTIDTNITVTFIGLPEPVITASVANDTICIDSQITLTATAPDAVAYLWNTGHTDAVLDTVLNVAGEHIFSVTVTTERGCVGDTMITIMVNDVPAAPISFVGDSVGCYTVELSTPFNPNYVYLWTDAGGVTGDANTFTARNNGLITLVVTDTVTGCTNQLTQNVTIDPNAFIEFLNDQDQIIDSLTAEVEQPLAYKVRLNANCVDANQRVRIDYQFYYQHPDSSGFEMIGLLTDYLTDNNAVTYDVMNKINADSNLTGFWEANDLYIDVNASSSIPPTGGTDASNDGRHYFLSNNVFNWFYLEFLGGRPVDVDITGFTKPGTYQVVYTLVAGNGGVPKQVDYDVNKYVGGSGILNPNVTLATRTFTMTITGEERFAGRTSSPNSIAKNNTTDANITIYPNPATSEFNMRVDGIEGKATVTITDLLGKVVERFDVNVRSGENTIQRSLGGMYKEGVYMININNGIVSKTKKLMITK